MPILPTAHDDKLAYLYGGRVHGETISSLSQPGGPAAPLRAYVASAPDLTLTVDSGGVMRIRYGEQVNWEVRIGRHDLVEAYSSSGFQDLMAALGIDFSGGSYSAG